MLGKQEYVQIIDNLRFLPFSEDVNKRVEIAIKHISEMFDEHFNTRLFTSDLEIIFNRYGEIDINQIYKIMSKIVNILKEKRVGF